MSGNRKAPSEREQCVTCTQQDRRFLPNLHTHKFWVEEENRWVKLRVSTKGMRLIDKLGIQEVMNRIRARGEKV